MNWPTSAFIFTQIANEVLGVKDLWYQHFKTCMTESLYLKPRGTRGIRPWMYELELNVFMESYHESHQMFELQCTMWISGAWI